MIDSFIPQASSFADDIDNLILFIGVIVMAWFFLAQGIFFYFILKFRAKPGQKAVDMDGYNPMHKKWITRPHNAVLFFDIFILAFAIKVWSGGREIKPVQCLGRQRRREPGDADRRTACFHHEPLDDGGGAITALLPSDH